MAKADESAKEKRQRKKAQQRVKDRIGRAVGRSGRTIERNGVVFHETEIGRGAFQRLMQVLTFWDRIVATYMFTLEDPELQTRPSALPGNLSFPKMNKANMKLFQEHWNSKNAKEQRFHNLQTLEPVGRAFFVAASLANKAFPKWARSMAFDAVRGRGVRIELDDAVRDGIARSGVVGEVFFKDKTIFNMIKDYYNSDEALDWIDRNGQLLISLPASVALGGLDPFITSAFKGVGKMKEFADYNFLKKAREVGTSKQKLENFLKANAEGNDINRTVVNAIWDDLKGNRLSAVAHLLGALGISRRTALSSLAEHMPKWFRRAGQPASPALQESIIKNMDMTRRLDEAHVEALAQNKKFKETVKDFNSEDWLEFGGVISTWEGVRNFVERTAAGLAKPLSQKVERAVGEYINTVELDFVRRQKNWPEIFKSRIEKAERIIRNEIKDFTASFKQTVFRTKVQKIEVERRRVNAVRDRLLKREAEEVPKIKEKIKAVDKELQLISGDQGRIIADKTKSNSEKAFLMKLNNSRIRRAERNKKQFEERMARLVEKKDIKKMTKQRLAVEKKLLSIADRETALDKFIASQVAGGERIGTVRRMVLKEPKVVKTRGAVTPKGEKISGVSARQFTNQEVLVNELTGKVIPLSEKALKKVLTQIRPLPPYMRYYFYEWIDEVAKTADDAIQVRTVARAQKYLKERQLKPVRTLEEIKKYWLNPKGQKKFMEKMDEIAFRAAGEFREGAYVNFLDDLKTGKAKFMKEPAEDFGGQAAKDRVLKTFDEVIAFAESKKTATPEERKLLLRMVQTGMTAVKQGWLFFTGGFLINNFTDAHGKNLLAMGPKEYFKGRINLFPIDPDAPMLNFSIGVRQVLGATDEVGFTLEEIPKIGGVLKKLPFAPQGRITGLFDLPGFGAAGSVSTSFTEITEAYVRNQLGSFVYHKNVEMLQAAARKSNTKFNAKEAHRLSLSAAIDAVRKTQFFVDELTQFEKVVEFFAPFSMTFGKENLKHWGRLMLAHPKTSAGALKIRERLDDSSFDSRKRFKIPNTNVRIGVSNLTAWSNALDAAERIRDPIRLDPNESQVMRSLSVLSSGTNALLGARPSSHIEFMGNVLAGKPLDMLAQAPDAESRRKQQDFLFSTQSLVHPLPSYIEAITGESIDNVAALMHDDGEPLAKRREWEIQKQKIAAFMGGRKIDDGTARLQGVASIRARAIGRLLGQNIDIDANDEMAQLNNLLDIYLTVGSNGRSLLLQRMRDVDLERISQGQSPRFHLPSNDRTSIDDPLGQNVLSAVAPLVNSPYPYGEELKRIQAQPTAELQANELRKLHEDTQRGLIDRATEWFFNTTDGFFKRLGEETRQDASVSGQTSSLPVAGPRGAVIALLGGITQAANAGIKLPDGLTTGLTEEQADNLADNITAPDAARIVVPVTESGRKRIARSEATLGTLKKSELALRELPTGEITGELRAFQRRAIPGAVPQASLAAAERQAELKNLIFLDAPVPLRNRKSLDTGGDTWFVDPQLMNIFTDPLLAPRQRQPASVLKKTLELNATMNHAWKTFVLGFSQAEYPEDIERLMEGNFERIGDRSVPYSFFLKQTKVDGVTAPRILHALRIKAQEGKLFSAEEKVYNFLETGALPTTVSINADKRKKQQLKRFDHWINRMRASGQNPVLHDPRAVLRDLNVRIDNKKAGVEELPKDFWPLITSDPSNAQTIYNFALAARAHRLPYLRALIYEPGREPGSEFIEQHGVDYALAHGMGPELAVFAAHDRTLASLLAKRDDTIDLDSAGPFILAEFLAEQKGMKIDAKTVANFAGLLDPNILADPKERATATALLSGVPGALSGLSGALAAGLSAKQQADIKKDVQKLLATGRSVGPELVLETNRTPKLKWPNEAYVDRQLTEGLPVRPDPSSVRSVTDWTRQVVQATAITNRRWREKSKAETEQLLLNVDLPGGEAERKRIIESVGAGAVQRNVFRTALTYLPSLPPEQAAVGAASIMRLGVAMGWVSQEDFRVIRRGILQSNLIGQGEAVATNILSLAGNTAASVTSVQRMQALRSAGHGPATLAFTKYGSSVGSLLSIGGGVATEAGEKTLGAALSSAGGAIAGAALGASIAGATAAATVTTSAALGTGATIGALGATEGAIVGSAAFPIVGTIIGAVIGAGIGLLSSGIFSGEGSDRRQELEDMRRARERFLAEQRRVQTGTRELAANQRILAQRRRAEQRQQLDRLATFFRRPTFRSSVGLIPQVERQTIQQLRPRF